VNVAYKKAKITMGMKLFGAWKKFNNFNKQKLTFGIIFCPWSIYY
jgi:hypothetical protein